MERIKTDDLVSQAMDKHGAFFAFSDKQFEEHKQEGVKYTSLMSGMIAPVDHAEELFNELNSIVDDSIQQDIAQNGIKAIIHRELANHEAQITYDITDTVEALAGYGITEAQVQAEWEEYIDYCVEHDYF